MKERVREHTYTLALCLCACFFGEVGGFRSYVRWWHVLKTINSKHFWERATAWCSQSLQAHAAKWVRIVISTRALLQSVIKHANISQHLCQIFGERFWKMFLDIKDTSGQAFDNDVWQTFGTHSIQTCRTFMELWLRFREF